MLPIKFNVSDIPASQQICDIQVSIQEDFRHLVYVGKPQPHQIPISFIGMPETSPDNIQIKDINEIPGQISIRENSHLVRFQQRFFNSVFDLQSRFALITDIYNTEPSGNPIPLFYKHPISGGFLTQPEILDQDMNPVPGDKFKLLASAHEIAIFHNLAPEYDTGSGYIKAYYIRYTSINGYQIFELLQSEPAFKEANIIDFPGGDKRVYTVRKLRGKFRYRILHNSTGPFFVKLTRESQLKLKKPVVARATDPWHLSISDGEFIAVNNAIVKHYHIPEFHFQVFSPIEPIQYSGTQECMAMTSHLAVAPFTNLLNDSDHTIQILVTNDLLEPKFGYTSGSTDPRPYWVDRFGRWREQGRAIRHPMTSMSDAGVSFNKSSGIFHLPNEILPTDRVFIRAFKEARDFTYLGLNINPLHNRNMVTGHAIIYALPESDLDEFQVAIQHLILDSNNNIIQWSDTRLGEDGTLNAELIPDSDAETGFDLFKALYPYNLILGSIHISREASVENLTYIDVREKGGGLADIVEENLARYIEQYPELQWLSDDSVSGRSLPIHGAFIVELPFSILDEAGGDLTRNDIEAMVTRHMSLGAFPIIDYYADRVEIANASYDGVQGELHVVWKEMSDADSYKIYVNGDIDGGILFYETEGSAYGIGFLREYIRLTSLNGAPEINLVPTDKLYIHISPIKNGVEWPTSETIELDLSIAGGSIRNFLDAVIASPPVVETTLDAIIAEA